MCFSNSSFSSARGDFTRNTIRRSLGGACQGPGRSPRRRNNRRRVHGPAGRLLWEDILPGEVRGRTLEDLVFHLESAGFLAQLGQLTLFVAGQSRGIRATLIGVVLGEPVPQT